MEMGVLNYSENTIIVKNVSNMLLVLYQRETCPDVVASTNNDTVWNCSDKLRESFIMPFTWQHE